MSLFKFIGIISISLFILSSEKTHAQKPSLISSYIKPIDLETGLLSTKSKKSLTDRGRVKPELVFSKIIKEPGAPWIQVYFEKFNLGKSSYLKITSSKDNHFQIHTTETLREWKGASAFFNGDEILVEVYQSSSDYEVFLKGDWINVGVTDLNRMSKYNTSSGSVECETGCHNGGADDRVSSNDPAIGRVVKATSGSNTSSTAWIASNGALVSAGHAASNLDAFNFVEFNVPLSNSDGTFNHPPPSDQYIVDDNSIIYDQGGAVRDYAIFNVFPNSNTGLFPAQAQKAFYRTSKDLNPSTVRITGFGADFDPQGTGSLSCDNSHNKTQQTHSGPASEGGTAGNEVWSFQVDVQGGNSGGPIIANGTNYSVGIITFCSLSFQNVTGISMDNNRIENALNDYFDINAFHVDKGSTMSLSDGSTFRPYKKIAYGVNNVPSGGSLRIVSDAYQENLTIAKPILLIASVGTVRIGEGATPISNSQYEYEENTIEETEVEELPKTIILNQNYPNPFNPSTNISFSVPHSEFVNLSIYDILGRKVSELVNQNLNAGTHNYDFDASYLSSGVYVYKLIVGVKTVTKKMLLLK